MKGPVFIDSNVWLYSFLRQDETKRQLATSLIKSRKSIVISSQIINEVCFNLKRNKIPESEIKAIASSFFKDFQVILFNEKLIHLASDLREKYSVSYWDSLVLAAALTSKCKFLYSEDMQHNQLIEKKLTIQNPFI